MLPILTREQMIQDLNLWESEQDLGICNADSQRLPEFIIYYRQVLQTYRLNDLEYEFGNLLLESANQIVNRQGPTDAVWDALKLVAARGKTETGKPVLEYWLGLADGQLVDVEEAFPIVGLLQEVVKRQ